MSSEEESMSNEALGTSSVLSNVPVVPRARTGVVFVHGGGKWETDYWEPVAKAVQKCIDGSSTLAAFAASGACYSDVINSPAAQTARTLALAPSENALLNALLWDGMRAGLAFTTPQLFFPQFIRNVVSSFVPGRNETPPVDKVWDAMANAALTQSLKEMRDQITQTVADVFFYLRDDPQFVKPIRQAVIDKLVDAQQYEKIVLVSHSLGTVVAFDVLNAWTGVQPRIAYWFTLGCPLTKVLRLRAGTPTRLNYANVEQWYNIFDTSDLVASPLCSQFSKSGNNLLDIFVNVGVGPMDSHNYFQDPTTLRLIADAVRETNRSSD
jgi:pimeloyl-ACP methyl ester carboxylesterase